jgi:hypothetical protein
MTKKQLFKKLKANGLPQKSGDWKDYEMGKALVFRGQFLEVAAYERIISWLAEYFRV